MDGGRKWTEGGNGRMENWMDGWTDGGRRNLSGGGTRDIEKAQWVYYLDLIVCDVGIEGWTEGGQWRIRKDIV